MQTHENPSFQPATSTVKNNLPAPRPFEDYTGQELDSLSTNPFPPRPHEVWMGEPRGGSTNPFPRRPHEVDMGEPVIARKPVNPSVQAEGNSEPEASPFIFGNQPFRMNAPDAPPPSTRRWGIQAKVAIGQPNDVHEQEADRVAEQVMSMAPPATPTVQRQEEEEEPEEVQTKPLAETIMPLVQRQEDVEDEPIQTKCETCEQEEPLQRAVDRPSSPVLPWWGTQAKLTIGQPNDVYEQEADRVAEQVMSMAPPATPTVQRQAEEEEPEELQTKPLAETITPLVQRQEVNLPPVPNYQLTPPSLVTPPSASAPYQLGGQYSFRLNRQMQVTALQYTQQQLTPATLTPLLSQLSLNPLSLTPPVASSGSAPSPTTPPAAAPAPTPAPPSPATADAKPEAPRSATPGDVLKAVLAMPAINTAIIQLQSQTKQRLHSDWKRLSAGEQVGVISSLAVVGSGAIAGIISSPDARQLVLGQLNGKVLPVPGINWLRVELNTGTDSLMMGLHLDVGALLPSILGFGPGSSPAIGGPPQPQPYVPGVQRAATSAAAPDPQHDLESRLSQSQGRGSALPDEVRSFMEPRFGVDFSQVRVHTDSEAVQMNQDFNAQAFTHKQDVYFGAEKSPANDALTAHELTHVVQQLNRFGFQQVQRKGGGTNSSTPGNSTSTGQVGIAGGESQTPSDQMSLAKGYTKHESDEQYNAPDGRVISKEQAIAESQVINSKGIFMGAYLARFNALKKYSGVDLNKLSTQAGFMQQLKTGDVVLRMMKADDSEGLAKVTDSNYSHSGIIQVSEGRVWVLDSYPGRGGKRSKEGGEEDSTKLATFEDFFGDQHGEEITRGIVLRVKGITDEVRNKINELINKYNIEKTSFDYNFKVDNGANVLYCSELVWRILKEASSSTLPANEFQFTKDIVTSLIAQLQGMIAIQKQQGANTTASEKQLAMLQDFLAQANSATAQELYSPGSLERSPGLETLTGFTRDGKIEGSFKVIVVNATIPPDSWDTPDGYVVYSGGLLSGNSKTSVKDDTTTPVWNEMIVTTTYDSLNTITLRLWDEDIVSDDLLATFKGDLRPVRPEGQTFTLNDSGATLTVKVEAEKSLPQAPRKTQ